MSKNNNRTGSRWSWKKIVCAFLAFAVVVVCVGGVATLAKNDTKKISPTKFEIGSLDDNGKYIKSEQALYTKEAFDCIGLRVEPDFEFKGTYDVYYYDYNDNLVEKKLGLSDIYDEDFPLAKMARVVIHPEIPEDIDEDDFKIKFYEKLSYASKLKITVDKNQNYLYEGSVNLYDESKVIANKTFWNGDDPSNWNTNTLIDSEYSKTSEKISITGEYEKYDIFVRPSSGYLCYVNVMLAKADGSIGRNDGSCRDFLNIPKTDSYAWTKLTIEIPKDVEIDHMCIVISSSVAECYIFGYND